jgi:hypothetical protein
MSGIDPTIIVHEIKTYPRDKLVRKHLHPIHPRKAATIKHDLKNFLKLVLFIPWH